MNTMMMTDDYDPFSPEERLLAERRGLSVEETASAIAHGDLRALFHDAGRVTPEYTRSVLAGWKELFRAQDREQTRARAAELKAAAAAKVPPKKPRPTRRRPFRYWG